MKRARAFCLAAVLSMSSVGCATHSTASDYRSVRDLTRSRTELDLPVAQVRSDREDPDEDVRAMVQQPLTVELAERVALLNNHSLRAELHSLGIARGQLVQASLLPNPEFDVALRFPEDSNENPTWDIEAGVDLTALILRGARTDVARAELDAARVRAASAVLDLGLRVRQEFYSVLARQQRLELMQAALTSFAGGYETARALHDAGNITELDLATEQAAYEAARVAVAGAEADLLDEREQLNVLLGFHGRETTWKIAGRLPDVPESAPDDAQLEAQAIEASLDLAATRATLTALSRQVGLGRDTGWLPDLTVGVSAEYEEDGWAVGPALSGTLPIFNQQQGAVLTSQARFDQLREQYVATAVEIRAAVRAARNRTLSAFERARHYRRVLLPLRKQVLEQTVLQYNAMQIGVFQLLQARRDELDAARAYIDTLREYWMTRADLDQLLAGRLADSVTASAATPRSGALPTMSVAEH